MHLAYHGLTVFGTVPNTHTVTGVVVITIMVRLSWQDVEPGRPVRSQLASAAKSPEEAFRRMKNKTFVVETKFDGQSSLPSCQSIASAANFICRKSGHAG